MAFFPGLAKFLTVIAVFIGLIPFVGRLTGSWIRSRTRQRKEILRTRAAAEAKEQAEKEKTTESSLNTASSSTSLDDGWEKINTGNKTPPQIIPKPSDKDETYDGIIAFFHPFCNAGGGGERVLYAAIHATQQRYPSALCVVYTGDHDVSKTQFLTNARNRFNITLNPSRVSFLYLSTREWVLASQWPYFTLLGQSLGSLVLGWEAFNLVVPDLLVDTMGYAFVLAFAKWLFPSLPTGAYVHYPTISTDMLDSLNDETASQGLNAGSGKGLRGQVKQAYWQLFAKLYSWVGGTIDVVMTNSTWTQRHITSLWSSSRSKNNKAQSIKIVYPPCAVRELHEKIPVDSKTESNRTRNLLYIAQFRPEKAHTTIISAFDLYLKTYHTSNPHAANIPKLILCGSVRTDPSSEDEKRVYALRLQAQPIKPHVEFLVNAPWERVLEQLRVCGVGVNGMWNEHFGIGVVEYQAAGLICVVNGSGGPKEDIVVPIDGEATGFHASTPEEFAEAFHKVLSLSEEETLAMRLRARKNSLRFSEEVFGTAWSEQLDYLVELSRANR